MIIAFSGGGARSFAHIGVIKAVLETPIKKDITGYSGTSGGALIAALFANNWTVDEVTTWALETDFAKLITFDAIGFIGHLGRPNGLMSNKKLGEHFDSLQKQGKLNPVDNLWINATNRETYEEEVFTKEDFKSLGYGTIIRASSSIPGIIGSINIDGQLFDDGGCASNPHIPDSVEPCLVFHLGYPSQNDNNQASWITNILSSIESIQYHRDKYEFNDFPNVQLIKIPVTQISSTDFGLSKAKKMQLIQYGYKTAQKVLSTFKFN